MKRIETDIAIVGAGSAGLCAAISASGLGARVMVFDENDRPGGQLFKQIHKFFGSREHRAGTRGYTIGRDLLREVEEKGAEVFLDSIVYGIFNDHALGVVRGNEHFQVKANKVILAGGAKENYLPFPGSTLPGVMGAGAAQTMININRVLPGEKVLMVGSGNVGLIVSYQLLQAGADVVALIEGAPTIGGYGVHASKISRAGVPILTGHTIIRALGEEKVEGAVIAELDANWHPIQGSEKEMLCDTICLAVGLNPMTELVYMAGCEMVFIPALGGHVPMHNQSMETTVPGIYVAGDITGVEEASTAMEEGALAGLSAAYSLGVISQEEAVCRAKGFDHRLKALRSGRFGEKRLSSKQKLLEAFLEYQRREADHE